MISTYTAKYTKIRSGYMGQLVEWPEVITEGGLWKSVEKCFKTLCEKWYWLIDSKAMKSLLGEPGWSK